LIAAELDQLGSRVILTLEHMMSAGYEFSDESFNRFLAFVAEKNGPKN
jgi:hypothetical protein